MTSLGPAEPCIDNDGRPQMHAACRMVHWWCVCHHHYTHFLFLHTPRQHSSFPGLHFSPRCTTFLALNRLRACGLGHSLGPKHCLFFLWHSPEQQSFPFLHGALRIPRPYPGSHCGAVGGATGLATGARDGGGDGGALGGTLGGALGGTRSTPSGSCMHFTSPLIRRTVSSPAVRIHAYTARLGHSVLQSLVLLSQRLLTGKWNPTGVITALSEEL